MRQQPIRQFILVVALASWFFDGIELWASSTAPPITVVFSSGRRVKAKIDPRTNADRLWLEFGSATVRLTRSLDWDEVSLYDATGQPLSQHGALALAREAAANAPSGKTSTSRIVLGPASPEVAHAARAEGTPPTEGRIRFIRFDAVVGNWDDDVEADGVMLQVIPLSETGQEVSVRGQLHVELWSMRRIDQDSAPRGRGRSLEILERWSVPIANDPQRSPAWIKLPFQARHPEFDVDWSSIGLVHVQLVAPGHGVFHHSLDGVRIRPFAPLRDALQFQTGERFFPTELNGPK